MPPPAYQPQLLAQGPSPQFVGYAEKIRSGAAAFYLGAGVSRASGVPLSWELVAAMKIAIEGELGFDVLQRDANGDPVVENGEPLLRSLEDIADEAEAISTQVLRSLQAIALTAAPFRTARPNYAHIALAFLLWEGVAPVFSANWDQCVEKAAGELGYALPATLTDADRLSRFKDALFHKVHGCASDSTSLMVTTSQIDHPPQWALSEVQAALSGRTVMFLGLGTVADYVEKRIRHVLSVVPAASVDYLVVTPAAPSASWQQLLPAQAAHSHEALGASPFLDELLRALWNRVTTMVAQRAQQMVATGAWDDDEIAKGMSAIRDAFKTADALSAFVWMRRGCGGVVTGEAAVLADAGQTLLLALAGLTDSRQLRVDGAGDALTVELEGRYVEFGYWPSQPSGHLVAEEQARADRRAAEGHYRDTAKPVLHVCLDPDGPLPCPDVAGDLVDHDEQGDLIDPRVEHQWVSARAIVEAGRTPALV